MAEYQAIREEVLAALGHQHTALSFGIASVSILVAGGSALFDDHVEIAGAIFILGVPIASALVLGVWFAQHNRMLRGGTFLLELAERVNQRLPEDALQWEAWILEEDEEEDRESRACKGEARRAKGESRVAAGAPIRRFKRGDPDRVERWTIIAVFALIAMGSVAIGISGLVPGHVVLMSVLLLVLAVIVVAVVLSLHVYWVSMEHLSKLRREPDPGRSR